MEVEVGGESMHRQLHMKRVQAPGMTTAKPMWINAGKKDNADGSDSLMAVAVLYSKRLYAWRFSLQSAVTSLAPAPAPAPAPPLSSSSSSVSVSSSMQLVPELPARITCSCVDERSRAGTTLIVLGDEAGCVHTVACESTAAEEMRAQTTGALKTSSCSSASALVSVSVDEDGRRVAATDALGRLSVTHLDGAGGSAYGGDATGLDKGGVLRDEDGLSRRVMWAGGNVILASSLAGVERIDVRTRPRASQVIARANLCGGVTAMDVMHAQPHVVAFGGRDASVAKLFDLRKTTSTWTGGGGDGGAAGEELAVSQSIPLGLDGCVRQLSFMDGGASIAACGEDGRLVRASLHAQGSAPLPPELIAEERGMTPIHGFDVCTGGRDGRELQWLISTAESESFVLLRSGLSRF